MKIIKNENTEWTIADGYKKKIFFDEDDLHQPGTLAQIVVVEPGSEVKPHYHAGAFEVIYVVEGNALMIIKGEIVHTAPGDIILTEPDDIHSVKNDSDKAWKVFVFKTNHESGDSIWLDK